MQLAADSDHLDINDQDRRQQHEAERTLHLREKQLASVILPAMASPHAILIPFPAQGHVIPFLELSYCLVDRGFDITFVNTEFNHNRVVAAISPDGGLEMGSRIHLVSVPDGLDHDGDRNDLGRLIEGLLKTWPGCLKDLIQKTNESGENNITCMIVDQNMAWLLEVAKKTGLRPATFFPASAAVLATSLSVSKLIEDKIIDADGVPIKEEMFELSPGIPPMNTAHFAWNLIGDAKTRKLMFSLSTGMSEASKTAEFVICNTFFDIELAVLNYAPNILPVGPLLTGQRLGKPIGHFWPEDAACIAWMDKQPANSVVYVAFGSHTIFDQRQFQELAIGLELTGQRFLWVVRPDLTDGASDAYPHGFRERTAGRGILVGWAPQQRVLAHSSVACFVTHCGWNSTMEGVRNAVRFLCWPYFADQFLNQSYIVDIWKTGLRLSPDETGVVSKEQIKSKVEELLRDDKMRARSLALKEMANRSVAEGGTSCKNLNSFADAMK